MAVNLPKTICVGAILIACVQGSACSSPPEPEPTHLAAPPEAAKPTPSQVQAPVAARTTPPQPTTKSRDSLGRLQASSRWAFGFPVPASAQQTSAIPTAEFYDLKATTKALEEFYAHRRFAVIAQPRGYHIKPTADSMADAEARGIPASLHAELHAYRVGRNHYSLRYFGPPEARAAQAPTAQAAAADPTADPTAEPTPSPSPRPDLRRAEVEGARRPTRQAPARPFNPAQPPQLGTIDVSKRIEAWKKANPGVPFND